jgi:hypothetical protein
MHLCHKQCVNELTSLMEKHTTLEGVNALDCRGGGGGGGGLILISQLSDISSVKYCDDACGC